MSTQLHSELKKEFQLERLILFSDAVFAIAITLLVLEIRVPDVDRHLATDKILLEKLDELIPKFVGFIISFFIIGLYWSIHHRMFGYVINYTRRMLWLNLFFLLAVVLMPFSTAFYSTYIIRLLKTPVIIYSSNIIFLGIMNLVLWRYISNPSLGLTEGLAREDRILFSLRAVAIPIIFTVTGFIYLAINPRLALWVPPFIPVIMRAIVVIFKRRINRKHRLATHKQNHKP
jgi:uncharacterized membrane protein